jgi:hypothetical protein
MANGTKRFAHPYGSFFERYLKSEHKFKYNIRPVSCPAERRREYEPMRAMPVMLSFDERPLQPQSQQSL